MRQKVFSLAGFATIAALAAAPAYAGFSATPEPDVAGGIAALAAMGLGYRVLRRRFRR